MNTFVRFMPGLVDSAALAVAGVLSPAGRLASLFALGLPFSGVRARAMH